jgi:DNA-binding Lrp family transcriptional regulator
MITQIGKKSTRGAILEILTENFPLTAKKIYNKIKASGSSVTYHAVYDRISELVKEKVLKKVELQYMINPKWVKETNKKLDKIKINYLTAVDEHLKDIGNISKAMVLTFKTYRQLIKYEKNYKFKALAKLDDDEKLTMCWITNHIVALLVDPIHYGNIHKEVSHKKYQSYLVSIGNTPLDKSIAKFVSSYPEIVKIKTGVKNVAKVNVGVYNNTILFFVQPHEIEKELEKFFKTTKSFEKMNVKKLNKILDKPTNCHIIIINDKDIAEYYRKYIKGFF